MQLSNFRTHLDTNNISYKKEYLLKYETYFKMGGKVHTFVMPKNLIELEQAVDYLTQTGNEYKIIGLTTNVYLLDELEYTIIITTKYLTSLKRTPEGIEVECGYPLQEFVRVTLLESSTGYEGLEGIPGSIGGAIVMNAGAYGSAISDNLISISCLTSDQKIITLKKEQCSFNHRNSIFKEKKDWVVLSALFKLTPGKQSEIAQKIETYHIARHSYQEFAYPNLGSIFSVQGDFYREFVKQDTLYYMLCYVLKIFYKNPVMKFIMRKNPNNIVFNKLLQKYLLPQEITHTYSSKSMNILVNDGRSEIDKILNYLALVKENLDSKTSIENEIVISPVIVKDDETKKIIDKINASGLLS
ncbi:MAG: FAD-binding protein [Helicobacteraceae bacterium]|jgi:UDP-N-acetylmuramate dehydrogenase|nr:FAD-binding protein [Helicobacteraceae bacterium]